MTNRKPARRTPGARTATPLYGEQTRLALANFDISGQRLPSPFIQALGLIKACAARVNGDLGLLPADLAGAVTEAALEVAEGRHDDQFPVDVFQTGSGTSSNMNANEVIAELARRRLGRPVHPNDNVNRGQSSNDVIPTAIHLSTALELGPLELALGSLAAAIRDRAREYDAVVKTGRTHLMDAVPLTLGDELSGWAAQGGTAVGTGLNAHPDFAARFAAALAERTGLAFRPAPNAFATIGAQDTAVKLSGLPEQELAQLLDPRRMARPHDGHRR